MWLLENGEYTEFTVIESRFEGKALRTVESILENQRSIIKSAAKDNLQAQIELAKHIENIVSGKDRGDVQVKNIRSARKREQTEHHRDYMEEAVKHD